jgi:hypothetical protein
MWSALCAAVDKLGTSSTWRGQAGVSSGDGKLSQQTLRGSQGSDAKNIPVDAISAHFPPPNRQ